MSASVKDHYLFWLSNSLSEFRLPEIESSFSALFGDSRWRDALVSVNFPFAVLRLEDEAAAVTLARRTTAVRAVFHQIASAESSQQLHVLLRDALKDEFSPVSVLCAGPTDNCPSCRTFRLCVEASYCKLSQSYKLSRIGEFEYLPLEGSVKLSDPDLSLHYIEQYSPAPDLSGRTAPCRVYFGRWLSGGPRALLAEHSLKRRVYIGNTSLDPQLALIMANLARVSCGSVMLDPFVGTGSTLVAAAALGAHVIGSDIDFLTVHARTRPSRVHDRGRPRGTEESIAANLRQYGLKHRLIDVLVADASTLQQLYCSRLKVNAIITDPPYGIRERNIRVGSEECHVVPEQYRNTHVPVKMTYTAGQLYADLLQLAAKRLTMAGRLVAWLPVCRESYSDQHIPSHPCLRVVANCEQILTSFTSRRLVVWQKWREPKNLTAERASVHNITSQFTKMYFESLNQKKN